MSLKGKAIYHNYKTKHNKRSFINVPMIIVHDSQFPFKSGDSVEVKIVGDTLVVKLKEKE